jgi:hypothetical protein
MPVPHLAPAQHGGGVAGVARRASVDRDGAVGVVVDGRARVLAATLTASGPGSGRRFESYNSKGTTDTVNWFTSVSATSS